MFKTNEIMGYIYNTTTPVSRTAVRLMAQPRYFILTSFITRYG